ncbi:transposase [Paraburkholderia sp. RAU6.4a]
MYRELLTHDARHGIYSAQDYPKRLRIPFKDPESGKRMMFMTTTTLPPLIIAALYKNRSQVERFFKWIKQPLRIKPSAQARTR